MEKKHSIITQHTEYYTFNNFVSSVGFCWIDINNLSIVDDLTIAATCDK